MCSVLSVNKDERENDMQEIYNLLKETEMLMIASPIYYHSLNAYWTDFILPLIR